MRPRSNQTWEGRKALFQPGDPLLEAIEMSASGAGVSTLTLVTGELQPEATALYRSSGYSDIEPYGVYAEGSSATFLGKEL